MSQLFAYSLLVITNILFTTYPAEAKRDFSIKLSTLNVTVNEKYFKSIVFKLYEQKAIFVEFILLRNIAEARLKLNFQIAKKDNRLLSLMNIDVDACDLLKRSYNNNLMKLIMREFFRAANLPRKCPLLANKSYSLKNYTVREEDFPVATPLVKFQFTYNFFTNNELLAIQIIKGQKLHQFVFKGVPNMNKLIGYPVTLFTIFFALPNLVTTERDFTIELFRLNANAANPKRLNNLAIKIYDRKLIFVEFSLVENITDFSVKVKVQTVKDDNQRLTLMDFNFKGCDLLMRFYKSNLAKVTMRELFRSSNIPRKCPVLADKVYCFKNYTIRAEDYPDWTPMVKFQLDLDFYANGQPTVKLTGNGRVRRIK